MNDALVISFIPDPGGAVAEMARALSVRCIRQRDEGPGAELTRPFARLEDQVLRKTTVKFQISQAYFPR